MVATSYFLLKPERSQKGAQMVEADVRIGLAPNDLLDELGVPCHVRA
jgi:hypothetical protein